MRIFSLFLFLLLASVAKGQDTTKNIQWVKPLYTRFDIQDFRNIRTVYYNKGRVWDSAFGADSVSFVRKSDGKTLAIDWQVVKYTEAEKESTYIDLTRHPTGLISTRKHVITHSPIWTEPQTCVTLSDLSQFLEECWNDSTQGYTYHRSDDEKNCNLRYPFIWRCRTESHYKTVWAHRLESASAMEVMREFVKYMEER